MLVRNKLNSMENKISKALINSEISHEELMAIINEEKKYRETFRMMNNKKSDNKKNSLIEEGKKVGTDEVIN